MTGSDLPLPELRERGPLIVLGPGEGESYWQPAPTDGYATIKISPANIASNHVTVVEQFVPPGKRLPAHGHPKNEELKLITTGTGIATVQGIDHPIEPGSLCVTGRWIEHSFLNTGDNVISDSRWDMTYLGMQVLIEGLALASFGLIRNQAGDPIAKSVNAYVMQDEARHVMFGRLALRDYYPQLTQRERDEREEFCVDACYRTRDRFLGEEVWETLGLPAEVAGYVDPSELQRTFRGFLFMRIVPILRDIGLGGDKVQKAFADIGCAGFRRGRHRCRHGRGRGRRRRARRPAHVAHPRRRRPGHQSRLIPAPCGRQARLCGGALEGEAVLGALARRVRTLELAGPVVRRYNNTPRTCSSLPLRLGR